MMWYSRFDSSIGSAAQSVVAGLMVLLLSVSGCGQPRKNQDYTPSTQTAMEAVRRGLEAWKAGKPAGEVEATSPVVHVTDVGRKPGQRLDAFDILGESPGPAGRTIAVSLRLSHPAEEVRTRYIVIGIDPLWVYRQEDFDLLMHWDHHMPAKTEQPETSAATTDDNLTDSLPGQP